MGNYSLKTETLSWLGGSIYNIYNTSGFDSWWNPFVIVLFSPEAILSSPIASSLAILPFQVLRILFQTSAVSPLECVAVQRAAMEVGAIQMILLCLAVLSHHKPRTTNHSHSLALQALSALTGRYVLNLETDHKKSPRARARVCVCVSGWVGDFGFH